jgi:uncharacterized protein (DUF305 family)
MTGRENADQCCRESHQRERAAAIIAAQTSEITRMQDWQEAWGYTNAGSPSNHDLPGM